MLGRFTCNGLDEALRSTDKSARPDARPFDLIILGGGSFGGVLAQHLLYNDKTHSHRILVLEVGRFVLPEQVQNLPMLGLSPPGPSVNDPGPQAEVWGLRWNTDVPKGFPGLAYCLGGRSIYFGGWSPLLLDGETKTWPTSVNTGLGKPEAISSRPAGRSASVQPTTSSMATCTLRCGRCSLTVSPPTKYLRRYRLLAATAPREDPAGSRP